MTFPKSDTRFHISMDTARGKVCYGVGGGLVQPLSDREREVMLLCARGITTDHIADCLCVEPSTVNTHLQRIFDKLHADNRTHAVVLALWYGQISFFEISQIIEGAE